MQRASEITGSAEHKRKVILAIDPGVSGAIVWGEASGVTPRGPGARGGFLIGGALPIPVLCLGGKDKPDIDAAAVCEIVRNIAPQLIVLEAVGAMPGDGRIAAFSFGRSLGLVEGAIAAASGRHNALKIAPRVWQADILSAIALDEAKRLVAARYPNMRLSKVKPTKLKSIGYCLKYFPGVPLDPGGSSRPHDGIADALCLWEFVARRTDLCK